MGNVNGYPVNKQNFGQLIAAQRKLGVVSFKIDNTKLNICFDGLAEAKLNVIKLQNSTTVNDTLTICTKLELKMQEIETNLAVVSQEMQIEKNGMDTQLNNNHKQKAALQQKIRQKSGEIVALTGKLQSEQNTLSQLQNNISDLERSINAKREKKKDLETAAITTGVVGGIASIFTLGGSAVAASIAAASTAAAVAILVNEMNAAQDRVNTLQSECNGARDRVSNTRNSISAKQNELNSYKQQLRGLEGTKVMFENSIKRIGRLVVNISNAIKHVKIVQNKCRLLITNVNTVKELADIPEFMKDPLQILAVNMEAAGNELLGVKKMIAF